jgi:hypothetical protein
MGAECKLFCRPTRRQVPRPAFSVAPPSNHRLWLILSMFSCEQDFCAGVAIATAFFFFFAFETTFIFFFFARRVGCIVRDIQVDQFACHSKRGRGAKLVHLSVKRNISLVINIYFLLCRTNSVRGLIVYG